MNAPTDLEAADFAGRTAPEKRAGDGVWMAVGVACVLLIAGAAVWARSNVTVPNVVGMLLADAEKTLDAEGLVVGKVTQTGALDVAPGTVTRQTPSADQRVSKGTAVDLTVAVTSNVEVPDVRRAAVVPVRRRSGPAAAFHTKQQFRDDWRLE